MRCPALVLAIVLSCVTLSAKHPKPQPVVVISLAPPDWDVRYSAGVKLQTLSGMAGWFFNVPAAPGHANYITTAYTKPLTSAQSIAFAVQIVPLAGNPEIVPSPEWDGSTCATAEVRLYIEQVVPKGCPDATYSCKGVTPAYRWWSNPEAVALTPGQAVLSVPIDPYHWSDAEGRFGSDPIAAAGFLGAMAHPAMVGMTFGSNCFYGHGVQIEDGSARFILTAFTIK